jgi:hypothetical protein
MYKASIHLVQHETNTKPLCFFEKSLYQSANRKIPERFNFQYTAARNSKRNGILCVEISLYLWRQVCIFLLRFVDTDVAKD